MMIIYHHHTPKKNIYVFFFFVTLVIYYNLFLYHLTVSRFLELTLTQSKMVQTRSQKRKKDEKKKKQHDAKMNTSKVLMIYVVLFLITVKSFRDLQTDRTYFVFRTSNRRRPFFRTKHVQQIFQFKSYGHLLGLRQYQQVSVRCLFS